MDWVLNMFLLIWNWDKNNWTQEVADLVVEVKCDPGRTGDSTLPFPTWKYNEDYN